MMQFCILCVYFYKYSQRTSLAFDFDQNVSQMLVILFVAVLGQFVKTQSGGCYSSCTQLNGYSCNICYQSCPQGTNEQGQNGTIQYNFTLTKCNYTSCVYWGKYYCDQYYSSNLSESDCIQTCCHNPTYSAFTNETFNQCVNEDESYEHKAGIIVGSVLGGVAFVGLTTWGTIRCIGWRRRKFTIRSVSDQLINIYQWQIYLRQLQRHSHVSNSSKSERRNASLFRSVKLIWTQIKSRQIDIFNENCTICFDSNINCQTCCGHKFHFLCFKQWIERKSRCPNCNNRLISNLTLYCQLCQEKQAKYFLKINTNKTNIHLESNLFVINAIFEHQYQKIK